MSHSRSATPAFIAVVCLIAVPGDCARAEAANTPDVAAGPNLIRYPDIRGNLIAFVAAGDIWTVSANGGIATRLTSHPGLELFPKFSPDGRWIAFTGHYDGDEQVFVMSSGGGVPKRLTSYPAWGPLPARWGSDNQVVGWTADGSSVVFRSYRDQRSVAASRLYTVPMAGGLSVPLPMVEAGSGAFSPDGKQILYTPQSRDFRTWKGYRGGWAQDLWIYDLNTGAARNVSRHESTDRDPIWNSQGIMFVSDRSGRLNLYRMDGDGSHVQQLTDHEQDVRWASGDDDGNVVYELHGSLRVRSADGMDRSILVQVPDDGIHSRPRVIGVGDQIEDFDLNPDGERVAVTARGDVFEMPVGTGAIRNLTHSDTHERLAKWSPDGTAVAYVSDATGEEELWLSQVDSGGGARQLTAGNRFRTFRIEWSPVGDRIAIGDHRGRIHVVEVSSGKLRTVGETGAWYKQDFSWSPDGEYLAFSSLEPTFQSSIFLWSAKKGVVRLTSPLSNEYNPVWNESGEYLYFLADRAFEPQINAIEWNYAVNRETSVLGIALRRDLPNPFGPIGSGSRDATPTASVAPAGNESTTKGAPTRVDFDGIESRVFRVPLESDNYEWLQLHGDELLLVRTDASYLGRKPGKPAELMAYSIVKRESRVIAKVLPATIDTGDETDPIWQVRQAGNAPTVMIMAAHKNLTAYDIPSGTAKMVATVNLRKVIDPRREWQVAFDEVWRRYRDFFYVSNMHGFDWDRIGVQYRELLPYVSHRSDLNYLIGEMISELNVGHAYVYGGESWSPARPPAMLIGATFELDATVGRYRIGSIFPGDNSDLIYRSPLTEVGVQVAPGDYVLKIGGVDLRGGQDPYALLREQSGTIVELFVSATADGAHGRRVFVETLKSERPLTYRSWVERNRELVDRLSDGRIGYLHLPDMGPEGIREFNRTYFGQLRKDGLIVDVRGNGGGNVSQMILERLFRRPYSLGYVQGEKYTRVYPWGFGGSRVFSGEIAVLVDGTTMSDGEVFSWTFQAARRGPIVGTRTWGGVIGTTDTGATVDGGELRVPQFALADANGHWVVEGTGVIPDIEVESDPADRVAGRDRQIERAVQAILDAIGERRPGRLPGPPSGPVKNADHGGN